MTTVDINGLGTSLVYGFFTTSAKVISATPGQFVLDDTGYIIGNGRILTANGSGLTYGDPNTNLLTGGTITSLTLQQASGYTESWSGFSVSATAAYAALKSGNITAFGNLFLGGNDTINVTSMTSPDNVGGVSVNAYDGDDTINFNSSNNAFSNFGIDGGNGNDTLNLSGGLSGTAHTSDFLESNSNLNIANIETVKLAAGASYTVIPTLAAGKTMTIDGTALGAAELMTIGTNLTGGTPTQGNLILLGGAANDIFQGGAGNDVFNGGGGFDTVSFLTGRPPAYASGVTVDLSLTSPQAVGANRGNDTFTSIENLIGTSYSDFLTGTAGNNVLAGGSGDDTLIGGGGSDILSGDDGRDEARFINVDFGGITINLNTGFATSGTGNTTKLVSIEDISVDGYNATLIGDSNDNDLIASYGTNFLAGGDGNDVLGDIGANSTLDGGAGFDSAVLNRVPNRYAGSNPVDPAYNLTFTPGVGQTLADGTQLTNIEQLYLTTGNGDDNLTFFHPVQSIPNLAQTGPYRSGWNGGDGNDTVTVDFSNFNSWVKLTAGPYPALASITLGSSQTLFNFSNVENFHIIGGSDGDYLTGGNGADIFTGNGGYDVLDGGGNIDTAVFNGARASFTITQSGGKFSIGGPEGIDTLSNIEYAKFDDQTVRLLPGSGTRVAPGTAPSGYMAAIRDFDGNNLMGQGTQVIDPGSGGLVSGGAWDGVSGWSLAGSADVSGSGSTAQILFNNLIGRWAEVTTQADGQVYFDNHGWAGDTRIVGIYTDPEVALGHATQGGPDDSQRRFQNDLFIGNIKTVLGAGDYNHDGFQEVYFSLTDGTAYLHALMWNDGNIRYANYQSEQQVKDYMLDNGVSAISLQGWFPAHEAPLAIISTSNGLTAPRSDTGVLAALTG